MAPSVLISFIDAGAFLTVVHCKNSCIMKSNSASTLLETCNTKQEQEDVVRGLASRHA